MFSTRASVLKTRKTFVGTSLLELQELDELYQFSTVKVRMTKFMHVCDFFLSPPKLISEGMTIFKTSSVFLLRRGYP